MGSETETADFAKSSVEIVVAEVEQDEVDLDLIQTGHEVAREQDAAMECSVVCDQVAEIVAS